MLWLLCWLSMHPIPVHIISETPRQVFFFFLATTFNIFVNGELILVVSHQGHICSHSSIHALIINACTNYKMHVKNSCFRI